MVAKFFKTKQEGGRNQETWIKEQDNLRITNLDTHLDRDINYTFRKKKV